MLRFWCVGTHASLPTSTPGLLLIPQPWNAIGNDPGMNAAAISLVNSDSFLLQPQASLELGKRDPAGSRADVVNKNKEVLKTRPNGHVLSVSKEAN